MIKIMTIASTAAIFAFNFSGSVFAQEPTSTPPDVFNSGCATAFSDVVDKAANPEDGQAPVVSFGFDDVFKGPGYNNNPDDGPPESGWTYDWRCLVKSREPS